MSGRHQPANGADSPAALAAAGIRLIELRDSEYRAIATEVGWTVWRPDDEERTTYHASDAEEARYASMLLNSGIDPDELDGMLRRVRCDYCSQIKFAAELDDSRRCVECQS